MNRCVIVKVVRTERNYLWIFNLLISIKVRSKHTKHIANSKLLSGSELQLWIDKTISVKGITISPSMEINWNLQGAYIPVNITSAEQIGFRNGKENTFQKQKITTSKRIKTIGIIIVRLSCIFTPFWL